MFMNTRNVVSHWIGKAIKMTAPWVDNDACLHIKANQIRLFDKMDFTAMLSVLISLFDTSAAEKSKSMACTTKQKSWCVMFLIITETLKSCLKDSI